MFLLLRFRFITAISISVSLGWRFIVILGDAEPDRRLTTLPGLSQIIAVLFENAPQKLGLRTHLLLGGGFSFLLDMAEEACHQLVRLICTGFLKSDCRRTVKFLGLDPP